MKFLNSSKNFLDSTNAYSIFLFSDNDSTKDLKVGKQFDTYPVSSCDLNLSTVITLDHFWILFYDHSCWWVEDVIDLTYQTLYFIGTNVNHNLSAFQNRNLQVEG